MKASVSSACVKTAGEISGSFALPTRTKNRPPGRRRLAIAATAAAAEWQAYYDGLGNTRVGTCTSGGRMQSGMGCEGGGEGARTLREDPQNVEALAVKHKVEGCPTIIILRGC